MPQTRGESPEEVGASSYLPIVQNRHGTDAGDLLNLSKRDFNPLSKSRTDHPEKATYQVLYARANKNCRPFIFLVDIKLALGNNPHLFSVLLLEPSCH
jgi:hypothetical protein